MFPSEFLLPCIFNHTSTYVGMIQTPEYGISSSFIKTPVAFEKPLGWFRTMIEFNNRDVHNWPDGSQGSSTFL